MMGLQQEDAEQQAMYAHLHVAQNALLPEHMPRPSQRVTVDCVLIECSISLY
jgi:hypothetical protein